MTVTETVVRETEFDLRISALDRVSDGVLSIELTPLDDSALPAWTPGAHVDLILGPDLVRQYSLSGDPADHGRWRVAVLLTPDSRGGSRAVHENLTVGDTIRVRGPRNHFVLAAAPSYEFVAGGIGITPILPMIAEAQAAGASWRLHYGGRTRASMAFTDELAQYGDKVTLVPQDESGHLDLQAILGTPAADTLVYCCGPTPLLDAIESTCETWPSGALHTERFAAQEVDTSGDSEFTVVFAQSGIEAKVPADKSVFTVARENDLSVLGSCLAGICGTCETDVLDGEVDHRDSVLDEDERAANETMMICVSRCRGPRLVLDI
ncbi:oxidoreductase [Gordonia sp. TBRC 11910]|uniref:Oxidoreductase n=1 Tax=Gordonia asplenii TaxID=2725283 RepID=A0A848L780_9ACTN|nr:PDR/VanB family oxidoreductase [Gordonia asplenii]NMO04563.1 oxidoreductase [Gordonia asplenii]